MLCSIHYTGSGLSGDLWVGELEGSDFDRLENSPQNLQEFLRERGIEFDLQRDLDIVALSPETAAELGCPT